MRCVDSEGQSHPYTSCTCALCVLLGHYQTPFLFSFYRFLSMSFSKRPTHRKRISALRLSSDTTSTLPEYNLTPGWSHHPSLHRLQPQTHWESRSRREGVVEDREEEVEIPSDKPPDYSDSAEEADEDTDESDNVVYQHLSSPALLPTRPHAVSPKRPKRFLQPTCSHKRKLSSQTHLLHSSSPSLHQKPRQSSERLPSSTDPFLDSLLERSVHALEMSNTLLQSSISTQTSLSVILAGGSGSPQENMLQAHAVNLNTKIKDTWDARAIWADNLEEITKDVEGLFSANFSVPDDTESEGKGRDGINIRRQTHRRESSGTSGISCSLPTSTLLSSGPVKRSIRRPSLDLQKASMDELKAPRLYYAQRSRENLISPPPRPITQFLPSTQVDDIILPSTIGTRSQPTLYHTDQWKSVSELASSSTTSLLGISSLSTPSLPPKLTDKPLEPSTPAYDMLASFVKRQPSSGTNTPSTSFATSFMANIRRPLRTTDTGPNGRSTTSYLNFHDCTMRPPNRVGVSPLLLHRTMTPTIEESSSSSDSCVAKRTVQSLKKILDEQPQQSAQTSLSGDRLKPPKFMPRTPAPVPEAGTSTATASISRLFTKGTHSSSTHAPLPPRQSAMKSSRSHSSSTASLITPSHSTEISLASPNHTVPASGVTASLSSSKTSSPTTLSIPEMVNKVLSVRAAASMSASASSSGRSTPNKRISFAELPESYASTRPGGSSSSKFKEKHSRRKRKAVLGSKDDGFDEDEGRGSRSAWWLGGFGGLSMNLARQEERMEDRITRGWAGRMGVGFMGGLDEWAV